VQTASGGRNENVAGIDMLGRCIRRGRAATVLAKDSTLVLIIGGEAYDGPPKLEMEFGGKPLGEGGVAAAINAARQAVWGRFSVKTGAS
jgi:hypothetical protein